MSIGDDVREKDLLVQVARDRGVDVSPLEVAMNNDEQLLNLVVERIRRKEQEEAVNK